jgi:hypothetical protein
MTYKQLYKNLSHPTVFISGVLQGIYQERDPRNLIISLDLVKFLMTNFFQHDLVEQQS